MIFLGEYFYCWTLFEEFYKLQKPVAFKVIFIIQRVALMINNTSDFIVDAYKPVLNIENAADLLGISKATVRNWIKSGQLPCI